MTLTHDLPETTTAALGDAFVVPTREELVERARSIAHIIKKNAAEGEENRRVVDESLQAMDDAGLFKIAVPKRYGGYETSMRTMLDVSAEVGAADGGTSWVLTLANVCAYLTSLFPERAQDEVFGADPDAKVSGVLAPTATSVKVDGGHRISGRWYYNSGSFHATWAVLGMPVTDERGEVVDQAFALIPRADLELEDTWFVAGMRSSASNCLIAEDVFVPDHRIMSVPAAIEGTFPSEHTDQETLYRSAFVPILVLVLVGPQLGLGRAALDYVRENCTKRTIPYTFFENQAASVSFQLSLARAAQMIDTAHMHAERAAQDIDDAAEQSVYPDVFTRARIRADAGTVVEQITGAIDILLSAAGAGSFADSNPLQRIWRDSAVAARHGAVMPLIGFEVYGKALVGSDERITPLL